MDWTVLFPDFKSEELCWQPRGNCSFSVNHIFSHGIFFLHLNLNVWFCGPWVGSLLTPQSLSSCLDGISVRLNTPIFICVSVWTLVYIFLQRCELGWAWLYDIKLNGWWRWSCRNTSAVFSVVDYSRSSLKVFFNDCRMKRLQYNWSSLWLY